MIDRRRDYRLVARRTLAGWRLVFLATFALSLIFSSCALGSTTRGVATIYAYDQIAANTQIAPTNAPHRPGRARTPISNAVRSSANANFAGFVAAEGAPLFTQRTASATFRHGAFQGRSIGDVAAGLRSGAISPSELPVQVIRRNGELLSLNTRSTLALRRGGIDPSDWVLRDVTGNAVWERRLTERLLRNQMGGGSDVIRITGAGPNASWLP